jgi:hypothetical protein
MFLVDHGESVHRRVPFQRQAVALSTKNMVKKVNKFTADAKHYFYVPMRQGTEGRGHKKLLLLQ